MKKVAVSQRVDIISARNERRDALDQRLCAWLGESDCLPVPVPNCLALANDKLPPELALDNWLAALVPDVIVLSGGNDIGQCLERDHTERALLDYAKKRSLPLLGICRGMQMMGVWAGAKLIPVTNHVRTHHQLTGEIEGLVNSFHDFSLAQCPDGFHVISTSEDGHIEAMRHNNLPWEGWMWHPERDKEFNAKDLRRLIALISV